MGKIPRATIFRAIKGDNSAIEEVIQVYDNYISKMATFNFRNKEGHSYRVVSVDAKQELKERLIKALPKWKGLKNDTFT